MQLAQQQLEEAKNNARQLAIQESVLRDQLTQLAPLQAQLEQIIRAKHQAIGAVEALIKAAGVTAPPQQQGATGG